MSVDRGGLTLTVTSWAGSRPTLLPVQSGGSAEITGDCIDDDREALAPACTVRACHSTTTTSCRPVSAVCTSSYCAWYSYAAPRPYSECGVACRPRWLSGAGNRSAGTTAQCFYKCLERASSRLAHSDILFVNHC
jgi:hypothetical protein